MSITILYSTVNGRMPEKLWNYGIARIALFDPFVGLYVVLVDAINGNAPDHRMHYG